MVKIAEQHKLERELIVFLLALREVEAGALGSELNLLSVQQGGLEWQVREVIRLLEIVEKERVRLLVEQREVSYYDSFFSCWGKYKLWYFTNPLELKDGYLDKLKTKIMEVENELSGIKNVGAGS